MDKIKYTKEVIDFIKGNSITLYRDEGVYHFIPFVLKQTDEVGVMELTSLKDEADNIKNDIIEALNATPTQEKIKEYATFCVECDRKGLPLLEFNDWINLKLKNKP